MLKFYSIFIYYCFYRFWALSPLVLKLFQRKKALCPISFISDSNETFSFIKYVPQRNLSQCPQYPSIQFSGFPWLKNYNEMKTLKAFFSKLIKRSYGFVVLKRRYMQYIVKVSERHIL